MTAITKRYSWNLLALDLWTLLGEEDYDSSENVSTDSYTYIFTYTDVQRESGVKYRGISRAISRTVMVYKRFASTFLPAQRTILCF